MSNKKPGADQPIYFKDGSVLYRGVMWPAPRKVSSEELWERLVADGVARISTPLGWLITACTRIAKAKGTTKDKVFVELDETVRDRCGRGLTIEPGVL